MAIEPIIAATKEAVSGETTEFTTEDRGFWLYGDHFSPGESAILERVGPSGDYIAATNSDGQIFVSAKPNTVFVDMPAGTYRIRKGATNVAASVGYEVEA